MLIKLNDVDYAVLLMAGWYRERLMPLVEVNLRPEYFGVIDVLTEYGLLERIDSAVVAYRITEAGVRACREYEEEKRSVRDDTLAALPHLRLPRRPTESGA